MKKVMIITGAQGVGKTTLARKITKGKKAIWTFPGMLYEVIRSIDSDTEYLVIEGADEIRWDDHFKSLITHETICIRKPYERFAKEFKTPQIILIMQGEFKFQPELLMRRSLIINLS